MHRLALTTSLLAGLAGMAWLASAQAAAYKWVDANGNVQYTQTPPPPGTRVEVVKPRGPSTEQSPTGPTPEEEDAALRKQQEAEQVKKELLEKENARNAEVARIKQENCKSGTDNLALLNSMPLRRLASTTGDGGPMTPEQHEAELARAQKLIDENCNGASSAGSSAPVSSTY